MESFFQSHAFLVEHADFPIRRTLMDTIDWNCRMIGIRGSRGVGRTSFLLQFAKENFSVSSRRCLYINLNSFYFQAKGIVEFAGRFVEQGGLVLLIDQAFKLPNWREQLFECYNRYPHLRIVYTTSAVEGTEDDSSPLAAISKSYVLHGFTFRDFVNLQTRLNLKTYTLDEILTSHEYIVKDIVQHVRPWIYFKDYLHHGYYPFFLENHNFTEALLKAMNMMIEVDLLFIKQIEINYLARLKKLLYLLAINSNTAPNVSRMAEEIGTSRATVMNYLKYLEEARLINLVYRPVGVGDPDEDLGDSSLPALPATRKPGAVLMHDTNLLYSVYTPSIEEQTIMETFFANALWRHHSVNVGRRAGYYLVDQQHEICVCDKSHRVKQASDVSYAKYNFELGRGKEIPLWLFGFVD